MERHKELRLTQTELAEKTSLTQTYLSMLERGKFEPTAPTIISLAVALDLSADELLGIRGKKIINLKEGEDVENKKKFIEELGTILMMYSKEKVKEFKYIVENSKEFVEIIYINDSVKYINITGDSCIAGFFANTLNYI